MKIYKYSDAPIEVHGLPFFHENGILERVPAEVREAVPSLKFLGRRCPGARLCFRTAAKKFKVRMTLETLSPDIGMSLFACQSANILIGDRPTARFAGLVTPPNYQTLTAEKQFWKSGEIEDITIFLPRNEVIADLEIEIADDAELLPPTPYRYPTMLYYGSSITEGGCCARLTNAYNAIISNHLNVDYINYGFSGSAKGELEMADLINKIPMSIFVYDYDHNAPSAEHLEATHEAFFLRIREKNDPYMNDALNRVFDDAANLLESDLPGVGRENIGLSVDGNVITITAQRPAPQWHKPEGEDKPQPARRMERRFELEGIDTAAITADYVDGVLKVILPKEQPEEKPQPRQIAIGGAPQAALTE
jgi:HSP20 family molecular chaperone IbpA